MLAGDREQLVLALQETLDLLDAIVDDLTDSRAQIAADQARGSATRALDDERTEDS